jgi:hypothetical protein
MCHRSLFAFGEKVEFVGFFAQQTGPEEASLQLLESV